MYELSKNKQSNKSKKVNLLGMDCYIYKYR